MWAEGDEALFLGGNEMRGFWNEVDLGLCLQALDGDASIPPHPSQGPGGNGGIGVLADFVDWYYIGTILTVRYHGEWSVGGVARLVLRISELHEELEVAGRVAGDGEFQLGELLCIPAGCVLVEGILALRDDGEGTIVVHCLAFHQQDSVLERGTLVGG